MPSSTRCARGVFAVLLLTFLLSATTAATAATAVAIAPTNAPRGARVVLTGTGLDDASVTVTFAGAVTVASARVVSRTATVLEVAVPATAITGNVRVNASGAVIATFPFTVAADPSFTSVATLAASD